MSKKTFLVSWKIIDGERYLVVGNVGVYKAFEKVDLEGDPETMNRAQLLALPYILDYAAENSLSSNCSIILIATQIPDRSTPYPGIDATMILDANNEYEANEMLDAVNEIYMSTGSRLITKLGMIPNDVLTRYKEFRDDSCMTTQQAVESVINELQSQAENQYRDENDHYDEEMFLDEDNEYAELMQYMDEYNYKFYRAIKPEPNPKKRSELEEQSNKHAVSLYYDFRNFLAQLKRLDLWCNHDDSYIIMMDCLNVLQYFAEGE
jgi:hypothetical protein